jgi:hypothetical protein
VAVVLSRTGRQLEEHEQAAQEQQLVAQQAEEEAAAAASAAAAERAEQDRLGAEWAEWAEQERLAAEEAAAVYCSPEWDLCYRSPSATTHPHPDSHRLVP